MGPVPACTGHREGPAGQAEYPGMTQPVPGESHPAGPSAERPLRPSLRSADLLGSLRLKSASKTDDPDWPSFAADVRWFLACVFGLVALVVLVVWL